MTNVRAQAIACILLWRVVVHGKTQKDLDMKDRRGLGSGASTKALAIVKLFEFFFETIPELLLQGHAVMYKHCVDGAGVVDGTVTVAVSIAISFATLLSGLTMTCKDLDTSRFIRNPHR